ncbi:MAG: class I SAM-dependent methyltransferase [Myxococcales bacterium]|nr:class I SAM-dependent methyltransferase [Myxococcales bacterium]MDH3485246.1 class I SAM-dependent methyltransferase [Myxococcales bacterium]
MVAPARRIATRVLHRIEHDDAWAAPTLDAELRRSSSSRIDAALATQIVYGVLRVLPALDAAIKQHASRPLRVDAWTHAALLGGTFQLLHLGRVPSHAVVNDTVDLVREKRGTRVAGFANAILRKIAATRPQDPQLPSKLVVPPWLDRALQDSIGADHTEALLRLEEDATSIDLRLRADADPDEVAASIRAARPGALVAPTALSSRGLRVSGGGDLRALETFVRGDFAVQEEGAQLVGELLGALPGERVLDVCAGRGGKTAQLIEAVGPSGTVVATDLHEHKLLQIPDELERLRLNAPSLERACVDWTMGPGNVSGLFDRVLVDAPCTGLGTLRRRPEILLRIGSDDAAQMGQTQRLILEHAAARVRPGGTLLFAVCSPLREEGTRVAERADLSGFELASSHSFGSKSLPFASSPPFDFGPWVPGSGPWADAYQIQVWVYVG